MAEPIIEDNLKTINEIPDSWDTIKGGSMIFEKRADHMLDVTLEIWDENGEDGDELFFSMSEADYWVLDEALSVEPTVEEVRAKLAEMGLIEA